MTDGKDERTQGNDMRLVWSNALGFAAVMSISLSATASDSNLAPAARREGQDLLARAQQAAEIAIE
jgi:hypothetical protein